MENNFIAQFVRKQKIYKNIISGFFWVLLIGFPVCCYLYLYLETVNIGINNLGVERYDDRMFDALLLTLVFAGCSSVVSIPCLIFINRRVEAYQQVLQQLTPAAINTFKIIYNSVLFFGKYFPSFIITEHVLHVFSFRQYKIPFNSITSHKISIRRFKSGWDYSVELRIIGGETCQFNISQNQIQLEQLKLWLADK